MLHRKRTIIGSLAIGAALLTVSATASWAEYPERPITMWIGFNPGGSVDTTGRLMADKLQKILGQPVVAVTKSGGGGTVMATQLKGTKADGYTIGMGASAAYALTPLLNKDIQYQITDFAHLATLTSPQDAIVVPGDSPWNSLDDMIADAKKNNRSLSMASQVAATRLMADVISTKSGVPIKVVPVRGGAVGVQEVMGGHVDFTWVGSGWSELAEAGKLKPLATMGDERNDDFPDIPTLKELGYDFAFTDTFMLSAPQGIPDEAMQKLTAAIDEAIHDPALQEQLHGKMHLQVSYRDAAETLEFLKEQRAEVEPLVERAQ